MDDLAARKAQLERRRAELVARMAGIETALHEHETRDWEEMATEREDDEMLEALGNSGAREVRQIDAALARIEDGEYGFCARCGSAISAERLDLLPATPFCKRCAE
ncbi:MAG: TraR/DksA family transcriptional regulator [Gemmobacter sp.]